MGTEAIQYQALASDYDGTLAKEGVVDKATVAALERLIRSGRRLILVTGRELPDLESAFPQLSLCARVVAENGALLYDPVTREKKVLAQRPPSRFVSSLRYKGVPDVSVGDVIVSTLAVYERQVIDSIREAGLDLQIILNKGSLMILPLGVDKMTGLSHALDELQLSAEQVVAIGDAENDQAFLDGCGFSVAVDNATQGLKERAHFVTRGARGAGVVEIIDKLVEDDLASLVSALSSVAQDAKIDPCRRR